jgi:hypothetical protein
MQRGMSVVLGSVVLLCLAVGSAWVVALEKPMPPSLYKPELKRNLTQEERWKLDFELANEAAMKNHNSRRFDAPGSFEKRARWFEETAQWYQIADLLRQLIDFRTSSMLNNEKAFNELVEQGKQGDAGAACIAAMLYRHHSTEATSGWKYSFDAVAHQALDAKESEHPVCVGQLGTHHMSGQLGYRKSRVLAKPYLIKEAVAGFYGSQQYLRSEHLPGALRFEPNEVALYLCWARVADQTSPMAQFGTKCEAYRQGIALDENLKSVPLPPHIQQLAREWCEPSRAVTAQTCADLEQKAERK